MFFVALGLLGALCRFFTLVFFDDCFCIVHCRVVFRLVSVRRILIFWRAALDPFFLFFLLFHQSCSVLSGSLKRDRIVADVFYFGLVLALSNGFFRLRVGFFADLFPKFRLI